MFPWEIKQIILVNLQWKMQLELGFFILFIYLFYEDISVSPIVG